MSKCRDGQGGGTGSCNCVCKFGETGQGPAATYPVSRGEEEEEGHALEAEMHSACSIVEKASSCV